MKNISLLIAANIFFFSALAQTPQQAVANMIRGKLGENCIIRDVNGKEVSFEFAAEQTIGASMLGKRIKYDPYKVIEGVNYEVILRVFEATAVKPTFDEIDFGNTQLGFFNESKKKIEAEEFKNTIKSNPTLVAAAFNAANGIVSDYYIIPKPKPASVQISDNNNTVSTQIVTSPLNTGSTLPSFKMIDIHGKKWNSKDLRDKIVVMNFWFIECAPCIAEMPSLNRLVEKYKENENIVFLSIANSKKEKIVKFLNKKEFKYAHVAQEQSRSYLAEWSITSYPQNVVVNKGKIVFSFAGGTATESDFIYKKLSEEIDTCLK